MKALHSVSKISKLILVGLTFGGIAMAGNPLEDMSQSAQVALEQNNASWIEAKTFMAEYGSNPVKPEGSVVRTLVLGFNYPITDPTAGYSQTGAAVDSIKVSLNGKQFLNVKAASDESLLPTLSKLVTEGSSYSMAFPTKALAEAALKQVVFFQLYLSQKFDADSDYHFTANGKEFLKMTTPELSAVFDDRCKKKGAIPFESSYGNKINEDVTLTSPIYFNMQPVMNENNLPTGKYEVLLRFQCLAAKQPGNHTDYFIEVYKKRFAIEPIVIP